jgi:sigma-B regulation protein RsbU (phosphoserine phosphatase)
MISSSAPRVLLLGSAPARSRHFLDRLQEKGLSATCLELGSVPTERVLEAADVLVGILDPREDSSDVDRLQTLLAQIPTDHIPTLLWGVPDNFEGLEGELTECLSANVGLDEVVDRLTALARYAPVVKHLETELQRLRRLGHHLNRYFEEVDQEMRLAGRLQHDFLPRSLPAVSPLRFAQLYRPATWVSGDIFDVFTIDEKYVGVFIADAMGHGTAAGLMTMYLRRALVPRQDQGDTQRIVPPAEAIHRLHDELVRQDLPNAQFVTAAYATIDVRSLDIRLARGGHPYPLHISAAGEIRELRCEGGLLGVSGMDLDFGEYHGRLAPGDKVIFYTDGLEDLFLAARDRQTGVAEFTEPLHNWVRLDADSFVQSLSTHLDRQAGSLNPADDVTVVVAEVT